ncbi:MAG TPA: alkaline phosphatase family protein, partial [Bryobacteraceae bacterium]|nr:alkaline phosphatase family protein [Bryobacteraceae bacterium]
DTFGINGDDSFWVAPYITTMDPNSQPPVTSIVDLLEAGGLTWKAYAENLQQVDIVQPPDVLFQPPESPVYPPPGPKPAPQSDPLFARRHVPFLCYPNIAGNPQRAANIVNAQATFASDLASGKLANYVWYTPNLVNIGHSIQESDGKVKSAVPGPQTIANIATFLEGFLGDDPLARFPPRTLIAITFDEAFPYTEYDIYTLLIGDMLHAGTHRSKPYNHYSLLRSIEDNFGIGSLGRNDVSATPYWFLAQHRTTDVAGAGAA